MADKKQFILIVDDNLNNLQVVARILKEENYLISLAQNGKQALEQLTDQTPDLLLLDVMMPEMDGFELCRNIRQQERFQNTPIIFLTAKNDSADLVDGFQAGGNDYITKPFNKEELLVRIRHHLELFESKKKIIEMNISRDKLYSIIAHDIRSPLSSISLMIDIISRGILKPGTEDFDEIMDGLNKTTKSTEALLGNLLEWTRFQSGKAILDPKLLKINPIILDCFQLLKQNANNKNISLSLDTENDFEAYFDEVTMHTVFRNLISNAIKFTSENGKIEIRTTTNNNFIDIEFKDTGVGMSQERIDKIFNKNEQQTSLGTNNEKGTGLGLTMVKDFAQKNNGKINVDSKRGEGTTFTISIPVSPEK